MRAITVIKAILVILIATSMLIRCVPDPGYTTNTTNPISSPTTTNRITYVGTMPCVEFFGRSPNAVYVYGISCDWSKFNGVSR